MDHPRERNRDQAIERLLGQSRREPPDGGVTAACLDAETIAAMMSGGLSGPAVEAAHAHLADCARCQSLAAALVRIDSVTQPQEAKHVWRSWLTWLVPLTAAAAAIVLWVVVPDRTSAPLRQVADVEKPAGEPTPQQQPSAPAPAASSAPAAPTAPADARADASDLERPSRVVVPDKPATPEQDFKPALSAAEASPSAVVAAAPPPPPAAPPPATAAAAPSANALGSTRMSARFEAAAGFEIVSPDPMIRWRIAGSSVERSTDGGARWDSQPTGSAAALTAGASPSSLVCWIVGRGGVVLRSIDGRSWIRVAFPEMTDLQSVRARDANSVSVTTADGRNFSTTDAGATWVPGLLQGF